MSRLTVRIVALALGLALLAGGAVFAMAPRSQAAPTQQAGPRAQTSTRPQIGIVAEPGDGGVRVQRVQPGSPAEEAGLRVGDVILSAGGVEVRTVEALADQIARAGAGNPLSLEVRRADGSTAAITVTPRAARVRALPVPPRLIPRLPWFVPGLDLQQAIPELGDVGALLTGDRLLGAQIQVRDQTGNPLTVKITPGTVTAVTGDSLTLRPNDGSAEVTVTVTDETVVRTGPVRRGMTAFRVNDRVLVVQVNDEQRARAIVAVAQDSSGDGGDQGWLLPDFAFELPGLDEGDLPFDFLFDLPDIPHFDTPRGPSATPLPRA